MSNIIAIIAFLIAVGALVLTLGFAVLKIFDKLENKHDPRG